MQFFNMFSIQPQSVHPGGSAYNFEEFLIECELRFLCEPSWWINYIIVDLGYAIMHSILIFDLVSFGLENFMHMPYGSVIQIVHLLPLWGHAP